MSDTPVLIVGAGISGLVLAQYLKSQGVRFEIFDRDSALDARTGGWGLTLHWALPALRALLPQDVVERFPETFVNKEASARGDVGSFQFFNLKSGEALYSVPAEERIRVNRGRLRELLTSGVDVQWNKVLQSIESSEDSITAHFEDGSSYTGRLLVASDGARSRARQILYPDGCQMNSLPVQLLGASTLYTTQDMGGAQSIDPYIFQGSHPDTNVFLFFSFLDTPNNFDESSKDRYHVQIIVSWADEKEIEVPEDNADRISLMKTLADNWAEPFRALVKKLPDDTEARSIRIEDWIFSPSRTHIHPRAVLMGDSAHTMTMFRGEGANNAIVDVQDLINHVDMKNPKSFDSDTLSNSLDAYKHEIFARVEPSFLNSRQACLDAHDFSRILAGSPLVAARILKKETN
ncbi:FAD-dependent monooxygenase [Penicillium cataractarum]|uniref:FAD-dependent monooxygenase n=1 Tax=Penicillium cataractarum TaxID=2100454 RepID=A0A9W9V8A1_9EURO|nr:FAD-dependent monooxygenase [Penicillium cataractarum]KAJ5370090.1 FAD-dependent monooxygenase [Penicillium cataractarum]